MTEGEPRHWHSGRSDSRPVTVTSRYCGNVTAAGPTRRYKVHDQDTVMASVHTAADQKLSLLLLLFFLADFKSLTQTCNR